MFQKGSEPTVPLTEEGGKKDKMIREIGRGKKNGVGKREGANKKRE